MNEQVYDEEIVIDSESSMESVLPSIESNNTLEDKLDRVEALLNEEISYRENQENENEMVTESGSEQPMLVTSSGVSTPDYSQYIYDLLTDSTIRVEIVQEDISEKPLNDYGITQVLLVLVLLALLVTIFGELLNKYIFKYRRR